MSRVRFQCRDCAKMGKGGFFSVKKPLPEKVTCPYCGGSNIRMLGE